jgi:hypothetical protein
MKKIIISLLMSAIVIPVQAQLGYRKIWERQIGELIIPDFIYQPYDILSKGRAVSHQMPNGNIVIRQLFKACSVKCSIEVIFNTFTIDSTFKTKGLIGTGYREPNFINGFFLLPKSEKPKPVIDKNFDLMGIYHASSSFAKTSKGDILFTREREFRQADTLVSYSKSNQFLWKRPIKAKSIDAYASRLGTIAHNLLGETAYIDDSSKLILLDSLGHLKRSIDIEKEGSKIMNLESQREWVVFFDDTHAKLKLQKFDWHGNLTLKSDIDVPRNWSIYSCIDLGNQGLVIVGTSLVSIDAKGQKRWEIPFSIGSEIYKPFSNGAILGYDTQKTGPEKATLISSNGKILLSTNISNVAESPDGGALIATSDSLYSINPKGEIAWGIKHSSSYAIVSNDKDGGVLLTESINMDTVAVRDYIYDSVFELGLNVSHQLSKFSKEGKLIWKTVLNFPPLDKYLFRTLSGAYAAEKDTYIVLYLFSDSQERLINNNLKHFHGQRNYLLKITRPCYERVSATLRSTSTALCPNQHLQLQANADSLGLLSYQWQRDGQTIANTTKPSLNINAGGTYRVVVRDSICGSSATSTEVRVVARPTPQASVSHTGNLEFCQNSDAPVLNTAISNTDWRYQWLRNGQPLLGIFQNSLKAETSGNYQISVRDSVCNTVSLSNTHRCSCEVSARSVYFSRKYRGGLCTFQSQTSRQRRCRTQLPMG